MDFINNLSDTFSHFQPSKPSLEIIQKQKNSGLRKLSDIAELLENDFMIMRSYLSLGEGSFARFKKNMLKLLTTSNKY